ncbi:MAG: PTS sugar transporter subunit IIA, partial [Sphingopyxis sp.]|nr:PTS sugar transporter subunit IIA [Sphingopyxis sp.]
MTDFSALLHGDTVLEGVTASSKKALINQLAAGLAHAHGLEAKAVSATLAAREKLGSTGFGGGIAIPHGKLDGLVQPVGLFARLAEPLDFQAIDELPVDLVFAMLSPPMAGAEHLRTLASVSRRLRDRNFVAKLRG